MVRQICPLADGHTASNAQGSLLNSEVKWRRARLVLVWGTAWEDLRGPVSICCFLRIRVSVFLFRMFCEMYAGGRASKKASVAASAQLVP